MRPVVELPRPAQLVGHRGCQVGEHSVRLRGVQELDPRAGQPLGETSGHRVRVRRGTQPQVALEQRDQLRGQEPHLRGELHVHLAQVGHPGGSVGLQHDDGLGEQQPVLGAAERHDVDAHVGGQRAQRHAQRGRGVGEPCAVDVHPQPEVVRVGRDRPDLVGRVDRADLGRLGERDDARLRAVLVAEPPRLAVEQLGGELALGCGHGQQLDAGHALRGAVLVGVDVRVARADHRAPGRQNGLQAQHVGTRAVEDRERLGVLPEVAADDLLQPCGPRIRAVRGLVPAVGGDESGHHLGVGAGVVVGGEVTVRGVVQGGHGTSLPRACVCSCSPRGSRRAAG